jgi:putative acetyltransferase
MPELALIEVRPYQTSDLDGVIELFLRSVREIAYLDYNRAQIDAWAQVDRDEWDKARLSRPTWVALIDGKLAGFIDLQVSGLIDMLFVSPDFQRRGVATALLARVEAEAGEAELPVLHTFASITAHSFFEKCGFTLLLARNVEVRGQRFVQCVMEKVL